MHKVARKKKEEPKEMTDEEFLKMLIYEFGIDATKRLVANMKELDEKGRFIVLDTKGSELYQGSRDGAMNFWADMELEPGCKVVEVDYGIELNRDTGKINIPETWDILNTIIEY